MANMPNVQWRTHPGPHLVSAVRSVPRTLKPLVNRAFEPAQQQAEDSGEGEERVWIVDAIITHAVDRDGDTLYLVAWEGWRGPGALTWEWEWDLACSQKLRLYRQHRRESY